VRQVFGLILLGFAGLLLVLKLMAMVDPVWTKLADDGDPYGDRYAPWWVHALWFAVIALLAGAGARLAR
jgi:hypothetical protein